MHVRRRTVLRAGVALAAAGTSGCSGLARSVGIGDFVRVAVSWSATELAAFRDVLAGRGVEDFELVPLGDDIDAALGARTTGRPHLVALPRPGLVAGNQANLELLPEELWHEEYNPIAKDKGTHYALPFKVAHKSVVWYRKKAFEERGLRPPETWAEWLGLKKRILDEPALGAPLALGGADGWMLSGVFVNILLRNFRNTYEALSEPDHDPELWRGSDVRSAFGMLAELWSRSGTFPGGVERALTQQFPDAVLEVFTYKRAMMVVVPDFAESVIRQQGVPDDEVGTFTFPARTAPGGPLVIAGDLFVLTRPAHPRAVELIRYLGTARAPEPWIRGTGGFLAANPDTDRLSYSQTLRKLDREWRDWQPGVSFDLADQLGAAGGRDGLQLVLRDFLRALSDDRSPEDAVAAAVEAMVAVEAG